MSNTLSRRTILQSLGLGAGLVATGTTLAACGGNGSKSSANRNVGQNIDEIIKLAKEEGEVRLIAYPETWANYSGHFQKFEEKYGVKIKVDSPDASSAEELEAIKNLRGQETQPDVLDIGYSFTTPAINQKLIEPYKPSNWDAIPENLKDKDGMWVGAYYGVLTFGVNKKNVDVPTTFQDLSLIHI